MIIKSNHLLQDAKIDLIPGGMAMTTRRFLVVHFTGGWEAAGSVAFWRTPEAKGANAHILIDRDGGVTQCRPFDRTAGHAGKSKWTDPETRIQYDGLNSCSIGIELCNCGDLQRERYPLALGGGAIPRQSARHKNGGKVTLWETYDQRQLLTLWDLSLALYQRYNLDDCVGHDDIAPERKNDPGPAFPMGRLRSHLGLTPLP